MNYNCDLKYDLMFLDQSFINKNFYRSMTWLSYENYFHKPSFLEYRFAMIAEDSCDGISDFHNLTSVNIYNELPEHQKFGSLYNPFLSIRKQNSRLS